MSEYTDDICDICYRSFDEEEQGLRLKRENDFLWVCESCIAMADRTLLVEGRQVITQEGAR